MAWIRGQVRESGGGHDPYGRREARLRQAGQSGQTMRSMQDPMSREDPRDLRQPVNDVERRWQIRHQLWIESQPAYPQAHLPRERRAEAEREARAEALLEAAQRGGRNGRDGHGR